MDEDGVAGSREERVARHEAHRVAVDHVLPADGLQAGRSQGRVDRNGRVDGDAARPVDRRHGLDGAERARGAQPVSRRQSSPR